MQETNQPRFLLLGATFETGNLGVSALAAGTIKSMLTAHPGASVHLLDYGTKPTVYLLRMGDRDVPVPLVNMRFSIRFYLSNNIALLILLVAALRLIPFQGVRERLMARNKCLRHILNADIVASIAGGDSFSDIYGLTRLFYVALPQILVLLAGKRLTLLPQTIGPFRGSFARMVAKFIVRRARQVYSRDRQGLKELKSLQGLGQDSVNGQFCYDVGFAVDPVPPSHLEISGLTLSKETTKNLVGLNLSGLLFMGGYSQNNMFGLRANYQELIDRLIDLFITQKGATVLLVPHVFGPEANSESDLAVCEKVYDALRNRYPNRLGFVRGSLNQSEIKHVIGRCEFFVGSRMHACIAALSQNVPAACVAYSEKFIGVMETIGIESLVADARSLSMEEILNVVDRSYEHRDSVRAQLARKMPGVRTALVGLFSGLTKTAIAGAF